jgi:hypothetical protein
MDIAQAQRDVRTTYLGGFAGGLVSGTLWLASAAIATWNSPRLGILVLVVGGMFIFPLTVLVLRAMGRPGLLPHGHPMNALAMQVAFTVPLAIPVALGATVARIEWFYPAMMVIVGAHYLPFIFLYGMPVFAVLGGVLVAGGWMLGLYVRDVPSAGGWITGVLLLAFAFVGRAIVVKERPPSA